MEKLACLISKKVSGKSRHPIHVSKGGPGICHLFFANDDLSVVYQSSQGSNTCYQIRVLSSFCNSSELKVSFEKSRVMC